MIGKWHIFCSDIDFVSCHAVNLSTAVFSYMCTINLLALGLCAYVYVLLSCMYMYVYVLYMYMYVPTAGGRWLCTG